MQVLETDECCGQARIDGMLWPGIGGLLIRRAVDNGCFERDNRKRLVE